MSSRHRARRAIPMAIALMLLALCATSCASWHQTQAAQFCALMSDSIGLYRGNPVTAMGYKIGSVSTIEPRGTEVKVGFTINGGRPIPRNVKAVTRSPSILADRSLELVGNYEGGPRLVPGDCIPLSHTSTPMSISQVIGSATEFVNGISPAGSTNIKDALSSIDQTVNGNGPDINKLLTTSSKLLDNPDQAIADLGAITRNMAELTSMVRTNRTAIKQIVQDMPVTGPDVARALVGGSNIGHGLGELITLVNDLELELGPEIQLLLDTVGDTVRIFSPHYKWVADALNPIPRFIGGLGGEAPGATAGALAKHINNHLFYLIRWRPPLFRIERPSLNGLALCGRMNATMPGSCADVAGKPYAVDVALLQYVLTEASHR